MELVVTKDLSGLQVIEQRLWINQSAIIFLRSTMQTSGHNQPEGAEIKAKGFINSHSVSDNIGCLVFSFLFFSGSLFQSLIFCNLMIVVNYRSMHLGNNTIGLLFQDFLQGDICFTICQVAFKIESEKARCTYLQFTHLIEALQQG